MNIVAHRGNSQEFPENTFSAFQSAFEMPHVFACECDVHLSRDKQLAVVHDSTLNRITGQSGWVRDFTVNQLQELDAGNGEKIPRLLDVLEMTRQYDKKLLVEIKGESASVADEITAELVDFVEENGVTTEIIVISFWIAPLRVFKNVYPRIQTGLILGNGFDTSRLLDLTLEARANILCSAHDYISEELVTEAHANELMVNAWTVNNNLVFDRMVSFGVDYISTDNPSLFADSQNPPADNEVDIFDTDS